MYRNTTFVKALAAGTCAALALAGCAGGDGDTGAGDDEQEEVTLSFVTGFAEDHPLNDGFWMFVDELEDRAPWIDIAHRGGPETMEPDVMIEAVTSGSVDGAMLPGEYYSAQLPVMDIARFTPFTPSEEREEGVSELWTSIHEDAGLHFVGRTVSGMPQVIFLTEEVDGPDFSGLSIRSSAATTTIIESLGGTPVDIANPDIYSALERGVAQGANFSAVGPAALGLHEVVNYDLSPRIYESLANVVLGLDTWNSLDEETQTVISETIIDLEPEIFEHYSDMVSEETQTWRDAGVELLELEGEDAEQILELAYVDAWDHLDWDNITDTNQEAEEIRSLFESRYEDDLQESVPGGIVEQ